MRRLLLSLLICLGISGSALAQSALNLPLCDTVPASGSVLYWNGHCVTTGVGNAMGTLVQTLTATNTATTLSFTAQLGAAPIYLLSCHGLVLASQSASLSVQFGQSSSYITAANYWYAWRGNTTANATASAGAENGTGILLNDSAINNANSDPLVFNMYIFDPSSASLHKFALFNVFFQNSAAGNHAEIEPGGGGYVGDTNAIDSVRIITSAGNINIGSCSLYALNG